MSLVELVKQKAPEGGTRRRNKYYISCTYEIDGAIIASPFKMDTGADCTVIGLDSITKDTFKELILNSNLPDATFATASGEIFKAKSFVVNNFEIAPGIVIPRIKLHFAKELGKKALLGMDIISLFYFQYMPDGGTHNGTFWLNNPEEILKTLDDYKLNNGIDYIDPDTLWSLDRSDASSILDKLQDSMGD